MILLVILILCNVLLAIIFKTFSKYQIDNLNAIVINYFVCVIIASLALSHFVIPRDLFSLSWFPFSLLLAVFFIIGFNLMAYSYQKAGVALTAIVAKMSLILPVVFVVVFYNESLPLLKILGILAAVAAIVLVNLPDKSESGSLKFTGFILLLPFLVWLLSGFIEILLYYVQVESYVTNNAMTFVATSFGLAGFFGMLYSCYRAATQKIYPTRKDIIAGIILGLPNFLTIYLLLYLLEKGWQGTVLFPINNIGILFLTALVGWLIYKEKMNIFKAIGIFLSLIAIILIGISG
ncbi:MAG: EamA family transporter [Saprospiraceae bacterium]